MTLAITLARYSRHSSAHTVAAQIDQSHREALLANPYVPDDLWSELYQVKGPTKVSVAGAKDAVRTYLTAGRVRHLLTVEKRASILKEAFEELYPTAEIIADPLYAPVLADTKIADKLHKRYGPLLDFDALADQPAENLAAGLRVWRLHSNKLTDHEVLAELTSFETWGNKYLQRPLGWVLHARPAVFAAIAANPPTPALITQAASCVHLGTLSAQEQATMLSIDADPTKVTVAEAQEWFYTWAAAASNPMFHVELLDALEAHMVRDRDRYDAGAGAQSRRNRRNWTVANLAETSDPSQIAELVRWTNPRGKLRLGALDQLLDNPHLCEDDVEPIARQIRHDLEHGELVDQVASGRHGRAVLDKFAARFPSVELDHELTLLHTDALVARIGVAAARSEEILDPDVTPEEATGLGGHFTPESTVRFGLDRNAVAWIDQHVEDTPAVWEVLFSMMETLGERRIKEIPDTCMALAM